MDFKILLKNRWLLVLGVVGLICLVVGTLWNSKTPATPTVAQSQTNTPDAAATVPDTAVGTDANGSTAQSSIAGIEAAYASAMQQMLTNLAGVNRVSVMVNISSTSLVTLANSTKTTTDTTVSGGRETRRSTSTDITPFTQDVGGNQTPVVVKTTTPQVTGVLVLVNARDFFVAKAEIVNAITNVWDVPAYNISVEPEK